MSNLTQLEMTLDEARETDRLIKRHINTTRYLLLDMRDRKGWKALGYESFKAYGEKELGYQEAHIYRLVEAAEVSLQIGYSPIGESVQPPESHLRPLKSIPEEARKEIWEEATRKAEEEHAKLTAKRVEEEVAQWKAANEDMQTKLATEQQRNKEWEEQNKANRDKIKALELDLGAAKSQKNPAPVIVEKIPDDYESVKAKAAKIELDIEKLKKDQTKLVNDQVKAKLQGYQSEVDEMESKKEIMQNEIDRMKKYMASLDSEAKRISVHCDVIEEVRLKLINLAAFLNDLDPMNDPDTIKKWLALAQMNEEASKTIRWVFGDRDESAGRDLRIVA